MMARGFRVALVLTLFTTSARAQEHRAMVAGTIGGASIGHADSEQGNAPIFGGAVGVHLTPRLLVEGDVQTASVSNVFGRAHHDFTETTLTASVLFRSAPDGHAHVLAGGGAGAQWAHIDVDEPPFRIDRTETILLLHGRGGVEWDLSPRWALRTEGVLWFGEGVDWILGARVGLGYRF